MENLGDDIIAEGDISFAVTTTVRLAFQFHQEQSPHLLLFFFPSGIDLTSSGEKGTDLYIFNTNQ